ncbi:hypothetical protein E5K58_00985 [Helicobacter pylori]|uniref:hypothetical protein n=1 Tax=Helicobacter pylori TaxID=210 RepID=UPI0013E38431|nr:hypothetical protein [Helicobacter pylori]MCQ2759276.1 hypothetical protein [Helicobacter pylori]MCQ2879900.1 hypothetical protein [Helicobacter pylori]MDU9756647.1 hypothetical protein [Helicobacter pylori]MDZ5336232.1 hypothetical protein [Helicobacter pylori]WQY59872.1 hypothetical protein KVJ59_01185 [Helicobacter pylori]
MFRDIVDILIPVVIIGLVLTAIRATIMAFKGDTDDDEVESDGFLVEYGINSLNISTLF